MTIEVVFKETNTEQGIKKNDIFTYEKEGNNYKTYSNNIKIVDHNNMTLTDREFIRCSINGLNEMGIKYEILRIKL